MSTGIASQSGGDERSITGQNVFNIDPPDADDVFKTPSPSAASARSAGPVTRSRSNNSIAETTGDMLVRTMNAMALRDANQVRTITSQAENPETTTAEGSGPSSSAMVAAGQFDAQAVFPASACLFVANLPQGEEDQRIAAAVTRSFSRFGTVWVKVKRERAGNNPFAFVQFTRDEHARAAMAQGAGQVILGRPCRIEMTRPQRIFLIYKRRGMISSEDVNSALERFGNFQVLEDLKPFEDSEKNAFKVQFDAFDISKALAKAFRNHSYIIVEPVPSGLDGSNEADSDFLRRYESEQRSVYVGNLPQDMEEAELRAMMEDVGDVVNVMIHHKDRSRGPPRNFAFVEFGSFTAPEDAIEAFDGNRIRGCTIVVERKQTGDRRSASSTPARSQSSQLENRRRFSVTTGSMPGAARTPESLSRASNATWRSRLHTETPVHSRPGLGLFHGDGSEDHARGRMSETRNTMGLRRGLAAQDWDRQDQSTGSFYGSRQSPSAGYPAIQQTTEGAYTYMPPYPAPNQGAILSAPFMATPYTSGYAYDNPTAYYGAGLMYPHPYLHGSYTCPFPPIASSNHAGIPSQPATEESNEDQAKGQDEM